MLLFGALADIAGWREREAADPTLSALRARLGGEQPDLGRALARPGVQVALDRVLRRDDAALLAETEIAFLPPMSGG